MLQQTCLGGLYVLACIPSTQARSVYHSPFWKTVRFPRRAKISTNARKGHDRDAARARIAFAARTAAAAPWRALPSSTASIEGRERAFGNVSPSDGARCNAAGRIARAVRTQAAGIRYPRRAASWAAARQSAHSPVNMMECPVTWNPCVSSSSCSRCARYGISASNRQPQTSHLRW